MAITANSEHKHIVLNYISLKFTHAFLEAPGDSLNCFARHCGCVKKGKWNNIIFNINVQQLSSHLDPVNGDCEAYEAPCPFHTIGCQDEEVGPVNTCYFTFEKPFFFLPQYC